MKENNRRNQWNRQRIEKEKRRNEKAIPSSVNQVPVT